MINYNEIKIANVYIRNSKAGELRKTENGIEFTYFENYLNGAKSIPVSKTLPLRKEKYSSKNLFPFFDNMILEGWLLSVSKKMFHLDKSDRFALLMATGLDMIGAVSVKGIVDGEELTEKYFEKIFPIPSLEPFELQSPFPEEICPYTLEDRSENKNASLRFARKLWGFDFEPEILLQPENKYEAFTLTIAGSSIAGAQRKGLFTIDKKRKILIPGGINTTHIIKPHGDFPELPENEHLTMSIARMSGFDVPPLGLFKVEELGNIFVIKRFDRTSKGKLMMEDMGQLLEIEPERKYNISYEKIVKVIEMYAEGAKIQLAEFFRRLVFCYITANGDMHAKNWSLLETEKLSGNYIMSPVYDFLNTRLPISQEKDDLGLPLSGKQSNLRGSCFKKFASERLQLPDKVILNTFEEISSWHENIQQLTPKSALNPISKEKYLELCNFRVSHFLNTL